MSLHLSRTKHETIKIGLLHKQRCPLRGHPGPYKGVGMFPNTVPFIHKFLKGMVSFSSDLTTVESQ